MARIKTAIPGPGRVIYAKHRPKAVVEVEREDGTKSELLLVDQFTDKYGLTRNSEIREDHYLNDRATIVEVGPPRKDGDAPWFIPGDEVLVQPNAGRNYWLGGKEGDPNAMMLTVAPYDAVIAKFVMEEEAPEGVAV